MTRLLCLALLFPSLVYGQAIVRGVPYAMGPGAAPSAVASPSTPAADTPAFSPAAGTYTSIQTVTVSSGTAGAALFYTTNGSTPTTSSTAYSAPVSVGSSQTLKAIATASGFSTSAVGSAAYVINLPVAGAPSASPAAGTYTAAQSVTLSSATPGAVIRYTTNGSAPGSGSTVYSAPISVATSLTVRAYSSATSYTDSSVADHAYVINIPVAAAPTFSPAAGTYTGTQSVSLSSATAGATIRYTTNGSDPTGASPAYSTPLSVAASGTLKALAQATGYTDSSIASAAYVINAPVAAAPTASPAAGTYTSVQSVSLSSTTPASTIRYTTDGSAPNGSSSVYSTALSVGTTQTIRAYAAASGYTDSSIADHAYTINLPQAATPTCSPAAGTYSSTQSVALSSATSGATIRYTTNGTDPTSGSTVYSSAVSVPSTMEIRSYATASGYTDSAIASCSYTISSGGLYALAAARSTTWNPGLNSVGGIPNRTTQCGSTLSPSGDTTGATDITAINNAITACGTNQVVQLAAGTFYVNGQGISIERSNVVLRGTLDGYNDLATTIEKVGGAGYSTIRIGNHWGAWAYGTSYNLSVDGAKGATSITLATTPSGLAAGDLVLIDQVRDSSLWLSPRMDVGGGDYPAAQGWFNRATRLVGQINEVSGVVGNVVSFNSPLHSSFTTANTAQMVRFSNTTRSYVGVEHIRFRNNHGGDTEGALNFANAKYSWYKHVENYMAGPHLEIMSAYRCEVRDSYFHESWVYEPSNGAYIVSFMRSSADNLIENNIVINANKVMLMRPSGGGNVISYNYMTDGHIASNPGWSETGLNASHMAGAHFELFEGNQGFNFGADDTWGGAFQIVAFRNHLQGLNRSYTDDEEIAAAKVARGHYYYSLVGNVLGFSGMTGWTYEYITNPFQERGIYEIGYAIASRSSAPDTGVLSTMLRDGNYDYVSNAQHWHGVGGSGVGNGLTPPADSTMPDSLYLSAKPSFMGSNTWPWVDPAGATKLFTLPARARYDSGFPNRL
jgi:hypothetical protein